MREKVNKILRSIERDGDRAVARLLKRWDGVSLGPSEWRVPLERARRALRDLPAETRRALETAARHIRRFHEEERRRTAKSWSVKSEGLTVGQRIGPVSAAGVYVPGGRFAYPSTVLMTAIPAKAAGVRRIVMATPPRHLTREVLAAAALAGVHEIYQLGGVAAVGALAYGTKTVAKVDLIVGPGGAWVTEAKRQVVGAAGIDLLAGPSEIVILADDAVPALFAASDMMAQAEHDPLARAYLVSPSARALENVKKEIDPRFKKQCVFKKASGWNAAIDEANRLAPEHLSLMVKNPGKFLPRIKNAGAIFLGPWSPVAAGDYWAGPSHVLPTGRSARYSSGLSVQTFMKRSSVIGFSEAAYRSKAAIIKPLAESEGLVRHGASLEARLK